MRLIIWLVLIICWALPVQAEDDQPYPKSRSQIIHNDTRLALSNFSYLPQYTDPGTSFVDQVTFDYRVYGTIDVEYTGIYGIIHSQARRKLHSEYRRQIRLIDRESNFSSEEINQLFGKLNDVYKPYGNWWERPWWASLEPHQGGAPLENKKLIVGTELNVPDWQIIKWGKRQIAKLGDIWISNDQQNENIEDGDWSIVPGQPPQEGTVGKFNGRKDIDLHIDEKSSWFASDFYHFRFKPSLRIRGGPKADQIIDEASMKFRIELFSGAKRTHFGDLTFFIRHDIPERETFASVTFELLTW